MPVGRIVAPVAAAVELEEAHLVLADVVPDRVAQQLEVAVLAEAEGDAAQGQRISLPVR